MTKPHKETELQNTGTKDSEKFEDLLDHKQPGFLKEFWDFFCNNKKWWLWPILISLLLVLILVLIGNSPLAPFFYPFI